MHNRTARAQWIGEHRNMARKQLLLARGFRAYEREAVHNVRQARVIAYVLDHYPVVIDDEDLLVGKHTTEPLSPAEAEELEDARPLLDRYRRGLWFGPGSGGVGGHRTVDFEKLLRLGLDGILAEVRRRADALDISAPDAAERAYFYQAAEISLRALSRFAARYRAALAKQLEAATGPDRRRDLTRLASAFDQVPDKPPRDFFEALQSVWFVQFALGFDDVSCTGHPDRYLFPYYRADLEAGALTRDAALRLIEELYLRSNEVFADWPETIMVGGLDRDGRPVINDLTYLFIEAVEGVGLVNPNVALCYREETPDDLLDLCLDKIGKGYSHPAIYNDEVITSGLVAAGLDPADARYYQNSTCVEITPVGTSNVQPAGVQLYPLKALECLLNGGRQMVEDRRFLPRFAGDEAVAAWARPLEEGGLQVDLAELRTFDDFYAAFKRAFAVTIHDCVTRAMRLAYRIAHYGSCPLVSCFVNDCIERGKDAAAGGARYNYWGTIIVGFSTAVDALSAIREAVYRRGCVTLVELRDALARDFSGDEALRQFLLNRTPKYGNDLPDVDALALDLYEFARAELGRYRTALGGAFHLGLFSGWGGQLDGKRVSLHVSAGSVTAATPDGRPAGAPLSECIGPAPGADRSGLTSMINSVAKLDHRYGLGGISVNVRLLPSLFKSEDGREAVRAFVREAMRKGCFELQMNVVDGETLREAKAHPELYRDLTVRIAGYSEYFCNVGEALQDELIARAEYRGV